MSATALTLAAGRPEVDMAVQFLSYKLKWVIYKRPKSFLQFNIVTDFSTGYTSPSYLSHFYNSISFYRVCDVGDRPHACCWPTGSGSWRYNFYPINSSGSFTNDLSHFYNSISSPTSAPGTQVRRILDFTWFAMSATALTLAAGRPEVDMAVQFLSYKLKWVIYKRPKSFLQFNIVTDFSTGYTSPSYLRFYLVCDVGDRPHACCWPTGSGYGVTISIL
jgi:hypothetical protein